MKSKEKREETKERKAKTMKNKQKGITLIALVITIIVLLILAGVSIATLTGDNGVLTQATRAKEETNKAEKEEQRQIAMYEAAMNFENTPYKDKNGVTVTIPAGFAVTGIDGEDTVDEGLVIIDSEGNEFVWIPVEDSASMEGEQLSDTPTWEKEEYEEMKKSVGKYKGFYIGRYEAGSTTERKGYYDKKGNGTTKMVVQRDQYPYNWVAWGVYDGATGDYSADAINNIIDDPYQGENNGKGAVYLCRHMYDGKAVGVKSTLCYGVQWDAMLSFIKGKDFDTDEDSTEWGNYYGLEFEITRKSAKKMLRIKDEVVEYKYVPWETAYGAFGANKDSYLLTTGATDRNMAVNLYDVAGNCAELTMEIFPDGDEKKRAYRGSSVQETRLSARVAGDKWRWNETAWTTEISFRPALYIIPTY